MAAFRSEAHRRKIKELVANGKIKPQDAAAMEQETGRARLPERVRPKEDAKPRKPRNR